MFWQEVEESDESDSNSSRAREEQGGVNRARVVPRVLSVPGYKGGRLVTGNGRKVRVIAHRLSESREKNNSGFPLSAAVSGT